MRIHLLAAPYIVQKIDRLDATAQAILAGQPGLRTVSRDADGYTLICPLPCLPHSDAAQWRALRLEGPLDFSLVGVAASVLNPLAAAGTSVLTVATWETDYFLVPANRIDDAARALREAGFTLLIEP